MTFTNVELQYQVTAQGPVLPANLESRMAAVVLPTGPEGDITQIADVTLASDTTAVSGSVVTRTLNFTLGPDFLMYFPVASDQKAPFRNLYTAILCNALSSVVTALDPVLS